MNTLKTYLPESFAYIANQNDSRKGHHNHVAKRFAINLQTPLTEQNNEQLAESDQDLLDYLKKLDS